MPLTCQTRVATAVSSAGLANSQGLHKQAQLMDTQYTVGICNQDSDIIKMVSDKDCLGLSK